MQVSNIFFEFGMPIGGNAWKRHQNRTRESVKGIAHFRSVMTRTPTIAASALISEAVFVAAEAMTADVVEVAVAIELAPQRFERTAEMNAVECTLVAVLVARTVPLVVARQ